MVDQNKPLNVMSLDRILELKRGFEVVREERINVLRDRQKATQIFICPNCNRKNTIPLTPITESREIKCKGRDCKIVIYKVIKFSPK